MQVQTEHVGKRTASKFLRQVLPAVGLFALFSAHRACAQTANLSAAVRPLAANALVLHELAPTAESTSAASDTASDGVARDASLPEAPSPQIALDPKPKRGTDPAQKIASKKALTIPSDWHAQPLTAKEKVIVGAEDLYSFETIAAMFISAGYEHVLNSAPNYGTDKGAFGARLGAAAIRESTQTAFSEIVFDPLLHEDPRYYVKGPKYNPVRRTLYAVTRPLITRSDDGSSTINGGLLLGYAASAAISPAYYPQSNRNFRDVASVYGGSIGGAALGFFVSEFSQDVLRSLHLSRQP